jgi:ABC-type glycerol-3-phosphate transport system substrate-binding protein
MAENLSGTVTNNPQPQPAPAVPAPLPPTKQRSKWPIILLILFMLVCVVGAGAYLFRDKFADPNAPVTLTYWGLWETPEMMQPILAAYKKIHPNITVKYEQRPLENHYETVQSRLKLAGKDIPDIVRLHSSWVPVLQNELAPLPSTVMTNKEFAATFYPVTKTDLLINGQYYGIPLQIDGLSLIYNQDMFNQVGITRAPQTWEEVRSDAARLTQRDASGKVLIGGIAMGESSNVDNFADIVGLLLAQNGVQIEDSKGTITFNKMVTGDGRNLGAEALSFYRLFSTTEQDWDKGMETSTVAFSKGKVGMVLASARQLASVVSQNPQLNYRVAPVPQLASDQQVGYASYWVESVARQSVHREQAWQFIKFLSSKEQEMALVQQEEKTLPFGMPPSRIDLTATYASDPVMGSYVAQEKMYQTSFFTNEAKATKFNDAIAASLAQALGRLNGGSTGANNDGGSAMDELAKSVKAILAQQ